jgi:hypothetical protein
MNFVNGRSALRGWSRWLCVAVAAVLPTTAATWAAAGSAAVQAAACTTTVSPGLEPQHLATLTAKPKYNSFPPTSGPHYSRPAIWDIYTKELPQVQLVHNLEHGGIVVQYGNRVPPATIAKLTAWYTAHSNGLVVSLLPALGGKIALAAWNAPAYGSTKTPDNGHGYLALCTRFDQPAFAAFVKAHRYKAGERLPPSILARGR